MSMTPREQSAVRFLSESLCCCIEILGRINTQHIIEDERKRQFLANCRCALDAVESETGISAEDTKLFIAGYSLMRAIKDIPQPPDSPSND